MIDYTSLWVGLCLFLAVTSYLAGYSRRAMQEEDRMRNRRRFIQKL